MSGTHAKIAPSSLALTVACPGSLQLQERVPNVDTPETLEGTAAHLVATAAARGDVWKVGHTFHSDGQTWVVDPDMHYGAKLFAEVAVRSETSQLETGVRIDRIHGQCWGTPDYSRYDSAARTLHIVEYKYGHRYVDPFENFQMTAYATGALAQLDICPGADDVTVKLTVVQPRAFHSAGPVQSWTTTVFGIQHLVSRARAFAELALSAEPPTATGAHCKDCRARHMCRTLRQSAAHIVDYSGTADIDELDTTAAAVELRIVDEAAQRLDARRTGLAAQVEAELRAGHRVPLWCLQPGRSKLDWRPDVSVSEVAALGSLIGVDLLSEPALITPTQAKKAGLAEGIIDSYAARRPAALSLKPDDSTAARKVFRAK